jgi:mevalonate pyrophosphate decarboxylase
MLSLTIYNISDKIEKKIEIEKDATIEKLIEKIFQIFKKNSEEFFIFLMYNKQPMSQINKNTIKKDILVIDYLKELEKGNNVKKKINCLFSSKKKFANF